jgi:diketogulonate reductase-like aldo/keto reductase
VNSESCADHDSCYAVTKSSGAAQLTLLGVSTLDMLMLDYPASNCDGIVGQWRAFEELYSAHKASHPVKP